MEEKVNVWKANINNGLILGSAGVVYTLIIYFLDMTFNKSVGYIFILASVFILYFFLKSYRDNVRHGMITYGQAVGAGVVIFLYYSVISAIFTYLLYTVIDSELPAKMLAYIEEEMRKAGKVPEESIETVMAFQKKMMQPAVIAPLSIFSNMLWGTIISLIVAIFVRKEGNPLVETTEKQPE